MDHDLLPASGGNTASRSGVGFRRLAPHGLSALLDEDSDSSEERLILGIPAQKELSTPDEDATSRVKATTETASSEYAAWLVKNIRKECTRRGLRLKSSLRKEERVEALERYDAAMSAYGEKLTGDGAQAVSRNGVPASGDKMRSKHCMFRLLNILFCDEFALRFCRTGDTATRSEIDGKLLNERSEFWQDVRAAFAEECPDDHERNLLEFNDDVFFSGIDPKMAKKEHTAKKLFRLWKEVNKNYVSAEAKFFSSGQNENDFRNFVNGRGDVLYLRTWLKKKPGHDKLRERWFTR